MDEINRTVARVIGALDRSLSELKEVARMDLDAADRQTVKHHAEDCIGLGNRVLHILGERDKAGKAQASEPSRPFLIGKQVRVYDHYRLGLPAEGKVVSESGVNDGVEVKLSSSNNPLIPAGTCVWVHSRQCEVLP